MELKEIAARYEQLADHYAAKAAESKAAGKLGIFDEEVELRFRLEAHRVRRMEAEQRLHDEHNAQVPHARAVERAERIAFTESSKSVALANADVIEHRKTFEKLMRDHTAATRELVEVIRGLKGQG